MVGVPITVCTTPGCSHPLLVSALGNVDKIPRYQDQNVTGPLPLYNFGINNINRSLIYRSVFVIESKVYY